MEEQQIEEIPPLDCLPNKKGPRPPRLRVAYKQRDAKCTQLKAFGWTYDEIAKEMGMSLGAVAKVIQRAYALAEKEMVRGACTLRGIALTQLDIATKAIMPQVEAGDLASIDRLLAIQARKAKLCGLDLAGPDQHITNQLTTIQLVEKVVVNTQQPALTSDNNHYVQFPQITEQPSTTSQDVSSEQTTTNGQDTISGQG